jgi:twitching motility protein PilT
MTTMQSIFEIMRRAADLKASDLFITVGVPPTFKINGQLRPAENEERLTPSSSETLIRQLFIREKDHQAFLEAGERDFSLSLPDIGRFRVNVFMQRGSWAASIRRIYTMLPDANALGIPDTVMALAHQQKGLVLVTGPTGCGKTTTLAALIDAINQQRSCHILTLEDPIEYLHRHQRSIINQREIGSDSHNYHSALRAALRQSPDVVLIGEMRDLETISIALTAAETGHLVLSTLHTVGAAKTIDRIIDVFPPNQQQQVRVQLSTVLQAVVSQQLIPSDVSGRAAAFEIMLINNAIRNMIREGKTPQIDGVIQLNANQGMVTMDQSIAELARSKQISLADAMQYAVSPDVMQRLVQRPG